MDKVYVVLLEFDDNEMYEDHMYFNNDFQGIFSSIEKATDYIHSCYSERNKIFEDGGEISSLEINTGSEEGVIKNYRFTTKSKWGDVCDYTYYIKEVTIDVE